MELPQKTVDGCTPLRVACAPPQETSEAVAQMLEESREMRRRLISQEGRFSALQHRSARQSSAQRGSKPRGLENPLACLQDEVWQLRARCEVTEITLEQVEGRLQRLDAQLLDVWLMTHSEHSSCGGGGGSDLGAGTVSPKHNGTRSKDPLKGQLQNLGTRTQKNGQDLALLSRNVEHVAQGVGRISAEISDRVDEVRKCSSPLTLSQMTCSSPTSLAASVSPPRTRREPTDVRDYVPWGDFLTVRRKLSSLEEGLEEIRSLAPQLSAVKGHTDNAKTNEEVAGIVAAAPQIEQAKEVEAPQSNLESQQMRQAIEEELDALRRQIAPLLESRRHTATVEAAVVAENASDLTQLQSTVRSLADAVGQPSEVVAELQRAVGMLQGEVAALKENATQSRVSTTLQNELERCSFQLALELVQSKRKGGAQEALNDVALDSTAESRWI